ncbi:MAG: SDR family NAD(P)-dependent oxidoreductase [Xanthomonadales bacterium]|nr:SDR family NAD(P)-dependent oxidoreductase [Xanthomonadales bacterium]
MANLVNDDGQPQGGHSMTQAKLLIIGASKGIGRCAVTAALERGCLVRAMARNPAAIELKHDRLELFSGDATDHEAVRRALDGVDAVLITLGIGSSPLRLLRPVTLFSRSTDVVVSEMLARGPRRLIVVTGYGAGDSRGALNAIEGMAHGLILGRAYADKGIQEEIVKRSGLDWTIVRPTILTNGPPQGKFQVLSTPESWRNGLISRADVAQFLVDRALDRQYLQESPVLAY